MMTDRNGLEVLNRTDALRLLATQAVGRIGITSEALPVVLPVNFALLDGEIYVRTGPGTKLDAATQNAVVAFEVDEVDPFSHSGWSVMVTGIARERRPDGVREIRPDTIPRWVPQGVGRLVYISLDLVDGRRLSSDVRAPGVLGPTALEAAQT